jgi:hypothetical protein
VGTRCRIGAVVCGVVMVLVGCGGGNRRLSAPEYARAASVVCVRANRAVARVTVPSFSSRRDAVHAMARVVTIERRTIDDLRALRPPGRLADTVQRWIALLDQAADELERTGMHLRAGRDGDAVEYGARATTLLDRARELVAPIRVTSCHGPELPTV